MAIILTGGTGKTSIRVARFLQNAKIQFLLLSRTGESLATSGMLGTKFDWMDESTFSTPFEYKFDNDKITAIYLIAPSVPDFYPKMNAFIDIAVQHGVNRFVVLASTTMTKDSPHHVGPVWQHLDNIGVEYSILKPTWFMGKFA
jgi:festuclavine dehydrogenase